MRTGVLAKKLGMSRYYTKDGFHIPVTLLQVEGCQVVAVKTEAKDGYNAVQLGFGEAKVKNVAKPQRGHFAKAKVEPKANLGEFRVAEKNLLNLGDELAANHFVVGQFVDVSGQTKGKGFAGGMKRHGFGGLEATHGVSISHRSHGSTGQCQDPGRVFKGKKMAGHLGDVKVTQQNLEIIDVDTDNGVLIVNGSVPGANESVVRVFDSVKRKVALGAPFPAGLKQASNDTKDKATEAKSVEEGAANKEESSDES